MSDLIRIFLSLAGLLVLAAVVVHWRDIAQAVGETREWWRRRGRPVVLEDTAWLKFWRRGMDDSMLRRRAAVGRWLRRHNRLRGARIRDQRALLSVAAEREAQGERTALRSLAGVEDTTEEAT